ncbi:MAG: hypothetical protein IPL61_17105 [Myxococcales bacterium]|nr:hypothetical protein [Myxococcales bacterium]
MPAWACRSPESVGRCDESAEVVAALTDLDGDGLPDILRVQDQLLTMESMVPGAGDDLLAVGRLRMITNAQGAVTTIGYANAKIDRVTAHAVPFPEIVVSSVRTRVVDGSAQDDATTYYRYGGASYVYDGKSARWVFPGYRRHLVLAGRSIVKAGEPVVSGVLTASDFDPTAPAGSDFTTVATASRLRVVSHAEGDFDPEDLDLYLTPGSVTPFASTELTYGVQARPASFEGAGVPALRWDCGDYFDGAAFLSPETCTANGVVYQASSKTWEGAPLPSADNVYAGATVLAVDAWGRPTSTRQDGDLRRTDDDVCVQLAYANGTPFPSVVTSVTSTDCGVREGAEHVLSRTRLLYDGLPFGSVGRGRVSARLVDRFSDAGYLDTHQDAAFTYDALGELSTVTSTRSLGTAATRTTTFEYDPFGATVTTTTVSSSDVAARFVRTTAVSTWPSLGATSEDQSGISTPVEFDALGRPTRTVGGAAERTDAAPGSIRRHAGAPSRHRRVVPRDHAHRSRGQRASAATRGHRARRAGPAAVHPGRARRQLRRRDRGLGPGRAR